MNRGSVLVTGAAGYLGSHTMVALIERGYDAIGIDDFSNASRSVVSRLAQVTGRMPIIVEMDVRDRVRLAALLRERSFVGALHFAARKSIEESFAEALAYYDVNVIGTLNLLQECLAAKVPHVVYSSSATVYDDRQLSPVDERASTRGASPYGHSKLIGERLLADLIPASPMRSAVLRYFNPVGAHPSGLIGEDPAGRPGNLMPVICRVAAAHQPQLTIYGNDYPTIDGTGVRDFVHVQDLAEAHVRALEALIEGSESLRLNIGTGQGTSVLQLIETFARVNGIDLAYRIGPRRQGDVAEMVASVELAATSIGWRAKRGLDQMCVDAWNFAQRPRGR